MAASGSMSSGPHPLGPESHRARESSSATGVTALGEFLRTRRARAGLTQRELADIAGLSTAALRDIEQGRSLRPRATSVRALVGALGLDASDEGIVNALIADSTTRAGPQPAVPADAPLRIGVLGPFEVRRGDSVIPIGSTQRVLLARLALSSPESVSRQVLGDLLRENGAHGDAYRLVPARITRIRRLVEPSGEHLITATPTGYRLALTTDQLDLAQFRALAEKSRSAKADEALDLMERAIGLWRGELDIPELRSDPVVSAVTEECISAASRFAMLARDLGQPERALPPLRSLAAALELHEPLHAELIGTLAATGRQAEALEAYERIRHKLREHLGIDPGERLRDAQLGVLQQRWVELASTTSRMPQQVPAAPPGFVGREVHLKHAADALTRDDGSSHPVSRIVLVHGPAGIGKTAWVHVAAHRLRDRYPDGQLYADLGGVSRVRTSPLVVLNRFLRALEVPADRIGNDVDESAALFRTELADRRMLVILDNVGDETQVRPLLPGAGHSDAIVTSRRALGGLEVAATVALAPMTTAESLEMIATARPETDRSSSDLEAARELARACGHFPLALRLATARLARRSSWQIADLLRRLAGGADRLALLHDGTTSITASFQASYVDLDSSAQRAFRLCSVHPGEDFDIHTACALTGEDEVVVEGALDDLLDANMLLQYAPDRYRYHDLLLVYANQLVDAVDRDDAFERLLCFYTDRLTAAMDRAFPKAVRMSSGSGPSLSFASEGEAVTWLDAEAGVLVTLAERASGDVRHAPFAWRIADQLRGYFVARRQTDGWNRVADAGVRALHPAGETRARAAVLMCRGQARSASGHDAAGLEDTLDALRNAEECGWSAAVTYLLHNVGWTHYELGDLDAADSWLRRILDAPQPDAVGHISAAAQNAIGMVMLDRGRWRDAEIHLQDALDASRAAGQERATLKIRGNLASAFRRQGRAQEAAHHLDEILHGFRLRGDVRGELSTLDEMSQLEADGRRSERALSLARQAHDLAVQVHDHRARVMTQCTLGEALLASGDLAEARDTLAQTVTLARAHSYRFFEARARVALARALRLSGHTAEAVDHADRAFSMAHEHGFAAVAQGARRLMSQT